jgi:hypothetical protein
MKKLFTIVLCIFAYTCFSQTPEGYKTLGRSLDAIGKTQPNQFTIFVGIDRDFAYSRFNRFLQSPRMNMTPDENSIRHQKGQFWEERYVRRVSSTGREFLTVRYELETSKTKPPYWQTHDGTSEIITKVKITGTADQIVHLFEWFWLGRNLRIEGNDREIASYQVKGDRVVLKREPQAGIFSITIEKGNIDFDYYSTFNIVAVPQE